MTERILFQINQHICNWRHSIATKAISYVSEFMDAMKSDTEWADFIEAKMHQPYSDLYAPFMWKVFEVTDVPDKKEKEIKYYTVRQFIGY